MKLEWVSLFLFKAHCERFAVLGLTTGCILLGTVRAVLLIPLLRSLEGGFLHMDLVCGDVLSLYLNHCIQT